MSSDFLPKSPIRVASIDVLRALTMFGMIFVNDLWTLKDIPYWLEHVTSDADGMGFADIVFPGFLFIVGMSIPFAVRNRQAKGDSKQQLTLHIFQRGLALLLMGVFLVNGENINETATGLSRGAWNVVSWVAFMVLWNQYPKNWNKRGIRIAQMLALLLLGALTIIYRGGTAENLSGFTTWWWGILGLIGWAYLLAALLFIWVQGKRLPLAIGAVLSLLISAAHHLHWLPEQGVLNTILSPVGHGAMTAFTIGGAWASQVFWKGHQEHRSMAKLSALFGGSALLLVAVGFLSRPLWGISKIQATPSWVMICIAIFLVLFLGIYQLVDQQQNSNWFALIRPGGTDTLLCYALPYFAYALIRPSGLYLPEWALTGMVGLLKSALFSLLMIQIAGWLSKKGLKLKL